MRSKLTIGVLTVAVAALLVTNPVISDAAGQITGKQIKNSSITGKDIKPNSVKGSDIKESSLGQVPSAATAVTATTAGAATKATRADSAATADGLSVAPSGTVLSGVFSAASSSSATTTGYLGFAVNYPRPIATPVPDNHIIDVISNPDPAHCPGAGQAAQGYLCLYNTVYSEASGGYGYSSDASMPLINGHSIGVIGYYQTSGTQPYVGGVWTVNVP